MTHLYPPPNVMYAVMSTHKIYGCYKTMAKAEEALEELRNTVGYIEGYHRLCKRNYFIKPAKIFTE